MKTARAMALLAATGALLAAPALAQEQAQNDDQAAARPGMPRLFFSPEERRILEALRRDLISEAGPAFDEFDPIQQGDNLEDLDIDLGREAQLQLNALVRNRSTGKTRLWVNNEPVGLDDRGGAPALDRHGVSRLSPDSQGAVTGVDSPNQSLFRLHVGQRLTEEGEVRETLPVISRSDGE